MATERKVETRNYYLNGIFGEKKILGIGAGISLLLIITILGTVLL
jgi:hypothetical protein